MITTPNDLLTISQLRAELKAVKAQAAVDSEAASSLFCVIADISLAVGIPDSEPNICRKTVKTVRGLVAERDALRAALRSVLDCPECFGTGAVSNGRGYENCSCVDNARRVLEEVKE